MERGGELLREHEVNAVRADLGENPASGLWIWGGGVPGTGTAPAPGPGIAFGRNPSFRGLALEAGLGVGEAGEDPEELGRAAVAALEDHELVIALVEEPLRRGRVGDSPGKVRALEEADEGVVGPLAEALVASGAGRLLVVASHGVSSDRRRDLLIPAPFALAGAGTKGIGDTPFTEEGASSADLTAEHGGELLAFAART
jgi:2,3-bisphosphoglycerate-independent phosphoglycerate mutase